MSKIQLYIYILTLPIEINHISAPHIHDGIIQNQDQPLLVLLAQQDITDDTSSISIHASISNDCEFLPIEINHISASHIHDEITQNHHCQFR